MEHEVENATSCTKRSGEKYDVGSSTAIDLSVNGAEQGENDLVVSTKRIVSLSKPELWSQFLQQYELLP